MNPLEDVDLLLSLTIYLFASFSRVIGTEVDLSYFLLLAQLA